MRRALAVLAGVAGWCVTAGAQCKVPIGSNEAKLLAFYSVPLVFSAAPSPESAHPGTVRLGLEGEYIPQPSSAVKRTGACFLQKSENTSLSRVFGRPRLTITLPWSVEVEGSYLPPVKIGAAKPDLLSLAISYSRHFSWFSMPGGQDLMLRANRSSGKVTGPITCPRASLQTATPSAPCYGRTPSNDEFMAHMYGGDLIAAFRSPDGAMAVYGGAGGIRMDPRFRVNFTDGNGQVDRTRVQFDRAHTKLGLTLGLTRRARSRFDLGAQLYSVPQDATTFRVHAGISFR